MIIDTTYNETPKLTWGEIITITGAAVVNAKTDGEITDDEAEKCFCVLSAAIDVMRDHKRAAELTFEAHARNRHGLRKHHQRSLDE